MRDVLDEVGGIVRDLEMRAEGSLMKGRDGFKSDGEGYQKSVVDHDGEFCGRC